MAKGKFEKQHTPKENPPETEKKSHRLRNILIIAGSVLVVAGIAVGVYFFTRPAPSVTIANDVYAAGVNLGGMTREEAAQALQSKLDETYGGHNMTLTILGSAEEHKRVTATIEKAPLPTDVLNFAVASGATPVDPDTLEIDPDSTLPSTVGSEPQTTPDSQTAEPSEPAEPAREDGKAVLEELVFSPQDVGLQMDVTGAVEEAYSIGREKKIKGRYEVNVMNHLTIDDGYIRTALTQFVEKNQSELIASKILETTTTIEVPAPADQPDAKPTSKTVDALAITVGQPGRTLKADDLYKMVMDGYAAMDFDHEYTVEEQFPDTIDLDALMEKYGKAPINASYDATTFRIIPEAAGFGFDKAEVLESIEKAKGGDVLTIPLTELAAPITVKVLEDSLFHDVLGEYDSPHTWNDDRTTNLDLACKAMNGTVILPGATFSFNDVVGERTPEKGYRKATAYVAGGKSEPEYGGGVCQVASTLYMATLLADLEVTSRAAHMYQVTYVPAGLDATIYWGYLDYCFVNTTPYPIRVVASVSDGYVHIKLMGTETRDYTVQLEGVYNGADDVYSYYISYMYKYDADGNEISCTKIADSSYRLHHVEDEEPTTESTTEETEPTTEETEPATEPTEPTTEPTEPTTEPTEPTTESTEPSTEEDPEPSTDEPEPDPSDDEPTE